MTPIHNNIMVHAESKQTLPPEHASHAYKKNPNAPSQPMPGEGLVNILGTQMYRIPDYDKLPPFLMSLVCDTDVWAYISSNGGLTAGRVEAARCIFPYETDDKLHLSHHHTGPQTIIRISAKAHTENWQPFRAHYSPSTSRALYKSVQGTQLVFEEISKTHNMRFRYRWAPTDRFGMVRTVWLKNLDTQHSVNIEVLDGLTNVLPADVPLSLMQTSSCLANAYTQAEIDHQTGMGIYSLTSLISDTADPGEALNANVVWSHGLPNPTHALTADEIEAFSRSGTFQQQHMVRNVRAAYLTHSTMDLPPGEERCWHIVADANLAQEDVVALRQSLVETNTLNAQIEEAVERSTQNITQNVASADGLQHTADRITVAHHFANVMFNNMRGGVIDNGYTIDTYDLHAFVQSRNKAASKRLLSLVDPAKHERINYAALQQAAKKSKDADIQRLCLEYLPVTFGRRHGDPSRPWNKFAIRVRTKGGSRVLDYQGNWRDIFQNWEGLCRSFPCYTLGMIAKFASASTADGFNPYRISRSGIDWEVPDEDDPWAHIGYWGDHQLIYLLKLMELAEDHWPGELRNMLHRRVLSTANVPYRIKPLDDLIANPRDSITFDHDLHKNIEAITHNVGSDGRLLMNDDGLVLHSTLMEKLLISLLAKASNLVVGGGVWMNTQRPEWNDANNALAGYGLSVVTTGYMYRYAKFVLGMVQQDNANDYQLAQPIATWVHALAEALENHSDLLQTTYVEDQSRMAALRDLGKAFETYRNTVYQHGLGSTHKATSHKIVRDLLEQIMRYAKHTLEVNQRDDTLYHSYNLISFSTDQHQAQVSHLPVMLEGQVSALSSGILQTEDAAQMVASLFKSDLYRKDLGTFLLYPHRDRPRYLEQNIIPAEHAEKNPLFTALQEAGETSVIVRDAQGTLRFSSSFTQASDLNNALNALRSNAKFTHLIEQHRTSVLDIYERVFNHHAFTGRSGTMYGYEGLGSVYWHMVSKLLLAIQERVFADDAQPQDTTTFTPAFTELQGLYYRVRSGLGVEKTATEYGAFPTDPYSHTPANRGAQQPGMTGQVKEEILTRAGELGMRVEDGKLVFRPLLLRRREFFNQDSSFEFIDVHNQKQSIPLGPNTLGFTCCQVPIIYRLKSPKDKSLPGLLTVFEDGTTNVQAEFALDESISRSIFTRAGRVRRIEVTFSEHPTLA